MKDDRKGYRWLTDERLTFAIKVLLATVLSLYLLTQILHVLARIGTIAILLIGAIFFAYLIYPVIRWLNRKLPLIAAILIVYATLIVLLVVTLIVIVPALTADVAGLIKQYPALVARVTDYIHRPRDPIVSRMPDWLKHEILIAPDRIVTWTRLHGLEAISHAMQLVLGTVAAVASVIVVPVLAAYLLMDSENVKRNFIAIIPERRRDATLTILGELEQVIVGFIRGQLLVGLSIGIIITVALLLLHVPYAVLIGALAGLLDFIPYVGPVLAFVPALFIALFNNGPTSALWVTLVFVAANQIEGHLIAPQIVSRSISLSPFAVLLAILVGAELGGVVGMFIAVPAAGMLRVLAKHIFPPKVSVEEAKPALTEAPRETTGLEDEPAVGETSA